MHIRFINVIIIFTGAIFVNCANSPTIQYATRFRNLTAFSPTGVAYLVCMKMHGNHLENYFSAQINLTKNFHVKSITTEVNKCVYESYACEHFIKFVVDRNIKEMVYNKKQLWSQMLYSVKPPIDLPIMKKGVYGSDRLFVNATDILPLYPEVLKYYFQCKLTVAEVNGKDVIILWTELEFHAFVKRNGNSNHRNSTTRS